MASGVAVGTTAGHGISAPHVVAALEEVEEPEVPTFDEDVYENEREVNH